MSAAQDNDLQEVRAGLLAATDSICLTLLGEPARDLSTRSQWRWGGKGGLKVDVAGPKRGLWVDHTNGDEGGDLLALIQRERGGNFPAALEWARAFLRMPEAERPRPKMAPATAGRADDDDATRISRAKRFASDSVAIDGTIAERYLLEERCIPKPAAGWPSSLRFHRMRCALLVVATNAAGDVRAVQLVHLTAEGVKRAAEPGRPAKQSFGVLDGAAVRLPGTGGPLLLAEGPETGLSAWAATGRETWVALGGMGKIQPPPLRRLVACADDDPRDAPAAKSLRKAISRWRAEGREVAVATPWSRRRFDKSDLNDLLRRGGVVAVLQRIEAAISPSPDGRPAPLPVDMARFRLGQAVAEFFVQARGFDPEADPDKAPPPIARGIRVGVGVGKSEAARREAAKLLAEMRARGDGRAIAIAVPTHKLGAEQAAAFEALPEACAAELRAAVWRGREAEDPDAPGERMCQDLAAVRDAQSVGASVESSACRKRGDDGGLCPFFETCAYQRQKQAEPDLWLVPHELLFTEKPTALGKLAALIVDEAAWQDGLEGVSGAPMDLTLDAIDDRVTVPNDLSRLATDRLRFIHNLVRAALQVHPDGPLERARLIDAGLTFDTARDGHALTWQRVVDPGLRPGMSPAVRRELLAEVAGNREAMRAARFFSALKALLADDGPEATGWASLATQKTDDGPVRVLRLRGRRDVRKGWKVPTLLLDALLDARLVAPFWPQVEVTAEIEARTPHMQVRQLTGRDWAKTALVPDDYAESGENERRLKNSERVRAAVLREARAAGGPVLVVAQKAVEDYWRQSGVPFPATVDLAHHNAVAGRDGWRDVRKLIVVGRTLPRPGDVERMAEALTGRAVTARASRYDRRDAPIEMADGTAVTAEADRHPDPIAEAIRWQICEGELIQIIGRGRAVNRTAATPLEVLVMTDRPLPLPVDATVTWDELAPGPADMMLSQGGVAFADSADASRAYPNLWSSAASARQAFHRARCVTFPNRESSIRECHAPRLQRVTYQRAGAGRRAAEATFDPEAVPDLQVWLEDRLGPLARCEVVPEPQAPAPPAPIPDPVPAPAAAVPLPNRKLETSPVQHGLSPAVVFPRAPEAAMGLEQMFRLASGHWIEIRGLAGVGGAVLIRPGPALFPAQQGEAPRNLSQPPPRAPIPAAAVGMEMGEVG